MQNNMAEKTLFVNKTTVLDIVKDNVHLPDNEICRHLFHAICREKSVELMYSESVKSQLQNCISDVKSNFGLSSHKIWHCKILKSEFVSLEQFQQISSMHGCVEGM